MSKYKIQPFLWKVFFHTHSTTFRWDDRGTVGSSVLQLRVHRCRMAGSYLKPGLVSVAACYSWQWEFHPQALKLSLGFQPSKTEKYYLKLQKLYVNHSLIPFCLWDLPTYLLNWHAFVCIHFTNRNPVNLLLLCILFSRIICI